MFAPAGTDWVAVKVAFLVNKPFVAYSGAKSVLSNVTSVAPSGTSLVYERVAFPSVTFKVTVAPGLTSVIVIDWSGNPPFSVIFWITGVFKETARSVTGISRVVVSL